MKYEITVQISNEMTDEGGYWELTTAGNDFAECIQEAVIVEVRKSGDYNQSDLTAIADSTLGRQALRILEKEISNA